MLRAIGAAATLAATMTTAALAAAPETTPTVGGPIEFPAGTVCADKMVFDSPVIRGQDSLFAMAPDGSQRWISRGMADSLVTNDETGATYRMHGGFSITLRFLADGSLRVDARGTDIIAWYYPEDDSELGPGLFHVTGHATEWYGTDGSLIRATFDGRAVDLCEALAPQ